MKRYLGWGICAVSLLAGCGGSGTAVGAWQAVRDTVGDTVVVRTVAGSVWGDTARLEPELRIGSLDGSAEYVLGDPAGLAVGNDAIYVLDSHEPVVRAYAAATGEHLLDVGREGGGPGEYGSPDGVAVLTDGRVVVRDPRTIHLNVYAPDGTFLEAWPHPNGGGFHTYARFHVDTAGTSYVTTLLDWSVPPWEWERALIGVSPAGRVTDTIPEPTLEYDRAHVTASRENSASRRQVPFTGERVWSFSPLGYTVGAITSRYAVYLFRPDAPVLRIERDVEPVAVHPDEAAERRARITAGLQRQYGSWKWNGPGIPDTKPPLRDLFADSDGRIWVVLAQPGRPIMTASEAREEAARMGEPVLRFQEPLAFDVFDPTGRYLGPVAAPPTLAVEPHLVVRGDTAWGVERDALGVPTVVRYRIVHHGG